MCFRAVCNVFSVLLVLTVDGANILGIFPMPSISHQSVFQPLWKELSLRGHRVVVVTPNPLKDPRLTNLTEIDTSYTYGYVRAAVKRISGELDHWDLLRVHPKLITKITEIVLKNEEVISNLLNANTTGFDLVITQAQFPTFLGFGYKFGCPTVEISSYGVASVIHNSMGNPTHPVLFPDMFVAHSSEPGFMEKLDAVIYKIVGDFFHNYVDLPYYNSLARKSFGFDMPNLEEQQKNVSLLLLNSNPVFHLSRPYGPKVVEINGMHLKPQAPLAKELQKFLDQSFEGVIYFSMGSNINSAQFDEAKRKMIMDAFAEIPYKVLWKYEGDGLSEKPKNIMTSSWIPQQDVLRHPNIRLFITQAGIQSTEEAIANQVPLLAIPIFVDQHFNAERIEKLGIGLKLELSKLDKNAFKTAVLEVARNPKYKHNIKNISKLMYDKPMTSLDTAVWWIEYVIRHNGTPHFRGKLVDVPWYEYLMLDVIFCLICIFAFVVYLFLKVVKYFALKFSSIRTKKLKLT